MIQTNKVFAPMLYLIGIVLVNLGFAYLPIFDTPFGPLPLMSFFVGFIFVLRDYSQRTTGHGVLIYMLIGVLIVWWLADAQLALASSVSFFLSEFIDWAVYTITKKPFGERVLISSVFAVPTDSIAFLALIGMLSVGAVVIMTISKFIASIIIWYIWRVNGWK